MTATRRQRTLRTVHQPVDSLAPLAVVADNDSGVSLLLQEVLTQAGFRTIGVDDGRAALAAVARDRVALLVCDLDMPELAGQDVLAQLDECPAAPPTLVISGYLDAAVQRELAQRRMVRGVFRKPFDVFAFAQHARRVVAGQAVAARDATPGASHSS